MSQNKRVFIVGHMGAGKKIVGFTLAEKLGWQFLDADLGFERMGLALNDLIGKSGQDMLHQREAELLAHYINKDQIVISTDSATVLSEKNRSLLADQFVVYLKVSTQVQLERIAREAFPLLPIEDAARFLDKLHERDALFESIAKLTINTDDAIDPQDDVNKIAKALNA